MNTAKLNCLTSLRAFAALLVVLQHTVGYEALSQIPIVGRFPWDHGVSFFFILSGFILTYVYQNLKRERWKDFFVARIARIWPAHLFALLLGFALNQYSLGAIALLFVNALMLQSWLPFSGAYFSYNGVSWSISTEVGFYLAFPFLILGFQRTWHWKLAIVVGLLVGSIAIATVAGLPGYSESPYVISYHGLVYVSPVARLLEFFVGMLAGQLFLQRSLKSQSLKSQSLTGWTALEIFVPLLAAANSLWLIAWLQTPWPAANEYLAHSGSLLPLALVVFVYAHQRGLVSRALSNPLFVFLGEISFSVYLLHVMLYWYIFRTFPDLGPAGRHLVFWPTLLVVASFSYLCVEQPARQMLRKRFSAPRTSTPPSAVASTYN